MARGLSDLQKSILIQAYKKLEQIGAYVDGKYYGMLFTAEVLAEYYGFEMQILYWQDGEPVLKDIDIGSQNFSKEQIGSKRYNSANAAVSKAFQRLEARGLITRYYSITGHVLLKLTKRGIEMAKRLLANTVT